MRIRERVSMRCRMFSQPHIYAMCKLVAGVTHKDALYIYIGGGGQYTAINNRFYCWS